MIHPTKSEASKEYHKILRVQMHPNRLAETSDDVSCSLFVIDELMLVSFGCLFTLQQNHTFLRQLSRASHKAFHTTHKAGCRFG